VGRGADTIMSPRWGWGRVGKGLIELCHPAGVGDEWEWGLIQLCHPAGVGDEWEWRADTIMSPRGGWGRVEWG